MQYLGLLFDLALLAVNLCGLMLLAGFFWRNRWFAVAVGPLLGVTAFFAIECQAGLGPSLRGLGLVGTLLSASIMAFAWTRWEPARIGPRWMVLLAEWRGEFAPNRLAGPLGVFACIFLYGLAWRFSNPNVDAGSERAADLAYICSYLTGATIPVPDAWLYPYLSTQYYSLQYYGAALMGRILVLSPGAVYNLAYCMVVGLAGTSFAGVVVLATKRTWVRILVIAGFMVGGTGITLVNHFVDTNVTPWTDMRFIGSDPMDKAPLGPWLKDYQDGFFKNEMVGLKNPDRRLDLPGEIFAYVVYLGDYHPPFSGYYLMGLGAMAVILWERERKRRFAAIAGATLTWTLLANTWVLPLQAMALIAWLGSNLREWRRVVPAFAAGAAVVWMAAWPYLIAFTGASSDFGVRIRLVPSALHTPPLLLVLFFLPTLVLILLGFVSGSAVGRRLAAFWLFLFFFTELVYAKDAYSGLFERFNTTLKWWPWVMAGTLMTLGPVVLAHATRRWVRVVGFAFCLYPCCYAVDLGRVFFSRLTAANDSLGHLEGTQFLTKDESSRLMLGRLKLERPGVVIERLAANDDLGNAGVLPLLAGQRLWIGSFSHELLWHGFPADLGRRRDKLVQLYGGNMADAGDWLLAQGIDYVLWYRPEDSPNLWDKVNRSMQPRFIWYDVLTEPGPVGRKVGLWKRVSAP